MARARLNQAERFFYNEAGYATPPGRTACARHLAAAEVYAAGQGWTFEAVNDDSADTSWMTKAEQAEPHEIVGVILRDDAGRVLGSLWSITDPSRAYLRVVRAELALEAMPSRQEVK